MKREEVLFYIANDKIYIYLVNAKKEVIESLDTSTFFKFGEISNVENCSDILGEFINKKNILNGLLKPIIYVLYNDVTNCDLTYLYKVGLQCLNYSDIKFIGMSDLLKKIKGFKKIVVYDKDYYTYLSKFYKTKNFDELGEDVIFIGYDRNKGMHFSDKNLLWNTFKSHFTK